MAVRQAGRTFPNPYGIAPPEGCEGYEEMYPYYVRFSAERREDDEKRSWFFDGTHCPEPVYPFDVVTADLAFMSLGQVNSRIFVVPPSLGIEHRVLNGYVYMTSNCVHDPEEVGRRAQLFLPRAQHYYRHWNELYDRWVGKVQAAIADLDGLPVPQLPAVEDESVVTEAAGTGSAHRLLLAYNRLLESVDLIWQYHFELLNLGYAAYLTFNELCREHFPGIADQTMARMVAGIDVTLFRPDDELKRLARAALDAGIAHRLTGVRDLTELERLSVDDAGAGWLDDLRRTMTPWFCFSYGNGLCHHHRSWIDDPHLPLQTIGDYVERLRAGEEIERPTAQVLRDRDRITNEYRELLPDDRARREFDATLGLARLVFPYVEGHNFYVEHWYNTIFWNKVRAFGGLLAGHGFFDSAEDVFYLQRHEVHDAFEDLRLAWAAGGRPVGGRHWRPIVERRRGMIERLRGWTPPPALGPVPEVIAEPMTIMRWGITVARVRSWLGGSSSAEVIGTAGSPGVVEGVARIVLDVGELGRVQDREILVVPVMSPSWIPVFGRIQGAVSDIGGVMSHAAIVAREYGLPAVVGTGFGTSAIRTGSRIRVDGDRGVVTLLDETDFAR